MTPIDKVSNIRRLPLLGTIRLGVKKEGKGSTSYPQAVDYFVCPPEVQEIYGEQPKELKIMLPTNDLEQVAPQYYKCYSYSQGLICRGTGTDSMRKVDSLTGDFANKETKQWSLSEAGCDPDNCPMIATKQCRRMMSLYFILYEVPGLGVYRMNTSSWHSIVNLNSQLASDGFLRQFTKGRIAFIPLILFLKEQVVTPMGEGRKTVHVLNVRADVKLADIILISRQRPAQVLLPTIEEEIPEEPPDDLYPEDILVEAESKPKEAPAMAEVKTEEELPEPNIDWDWPSEAMSSINWDEKTATSWIRNVLRADVKDSFKDTIKGLPREKLERFFNEIQVRADRLQPKLFSEKTT